MGVEGTLYEINANRSDDGHETMMKEEHINHRRLISAGTDTDVQALPKS